MTTDPLTPADRERLRRHGIAPEEALRQLALLRQPPPPARLVRPCRPGDGIERLDEARHEALLRRAEAGARAGRFLSFVPASGAASRMFASLLPFAEAPPPLGEIERRATAGDRPAADLLRFWRELDEFPFRVDLARAVARAGGDLAAARARGDVALVLRALLRSPGLGYADRPKALIPFHRYPQGARTPLEEHLVEAAAYAADLRRRCRLHFTVAPGREDDFWELLERAVPAVERALDLVFAIALSPQDPATDTLATDPEGRPFRTADGDLLLRPGGHGSLLRNLEAAGGDVVFVKNIDNVVPDRGKPLTVRWRRLLAGRLLEVETELHGHLDALESPAAAAVAAARAFATSTLGLDLPAELPAADLAARLDRPLRVCSVVENRGAPGGGPFWVKDAHGLVSRQIVEPPQVDPDDPGQQAIWEASTHFNPTDLVTALRDRHGRPYPLARYVDPTTVFIAEKTSGGRPLKALEHPGLWNGSMAGWHTVFVEVPYATFAPVKTVLDLLEPEHR